MNAIFYIALFFLMLIHVGLALFIRKGVLRFYPEKADFAVPVSIIVAVRNEAEYIQQCLTSLEQVDYPSQLLEIYVVNDRSTDETDEIISNFISDKSYFHYLVNRIKNANLSGKANAVSSAIEQSRGEIILITDADCEVPKNWIKKIIPFFQNDVGIVAGFTRLQHNNGLLSNLQSLDWSYMLTVAVGSIGLGLPLTSIGNNFAIRREAYEAVGGYSGVGFSVAEDFALLQAVSKNTNWKIVAPINQENIVKSQPVKNLSDFFQQRKRWAIGGKTVHWFGKLLIVTSLFAHAAILLFLLFRNLITAAVAFSILLMSDLFFLYPMLKKTDQLKDLLLLPVYKIFAFFYMLALSVILLFSPTVEWKGEKYFR